jgi:hypothetical protein
MYMTDLYNQNVEIYIYINRLLQNCPGQFILSSVKEIFYVSWTSSAHCCVNIHQPWNLASRQLSPVHAQFLSNQF